MTNEQDEVLQQAILEFGDTAQITMAIEECAELINVLCKQCRKRVNTQDIITEIADVTIMMRQLSMMYGEFPVEVEIKRKINRLRERIEKHNING